MKKIFITLMAICGFALQANADVTLYVGSTSLVAGEDGAISFWINSDKDVVAFQAVVTLPEGITFTGELEPTAIGESMYTASTSAIGGGVSGGTMNIIAMGLEGKGDLLFGTAPVTVADGAEGGIIAISTLKVQFTDGEKVTIDAPEAEGQNALAVADKLILDENAKSLPFYFEGDVTVKRALKANEWATICLPFEVADLAAIFGADVEAAEFTEYEAGEEGLEVSFDAVDAFEANMPYIVKPSVAVAEFDLTNAEVDPDESSAVAEMTNGKTGNKQIVSGAFIGTLHAGTAIPTIVALKKEKATQDAATLFVSGGKFFYTVEETQPIKAFRGYFAFVDADPNGGEVKMFVNGLETRIEEMQNNNVVSKGAIYDLTGKQVRNSNLKGIFIQDGKKVVK